MSRGEAMERIAMATASPTDSIYLSLWKRRVALKAVQRERQRGRGRGREEGRDVHGKKERRSYGGRSRGKEEYRT